MTHDMPGNGAFDERRIGLDHVAFQVADRVAECHRPGRIGIEGDNRFAPRGLVMAFQAAWTGYSAHMWGTEVGCVRSPYEANPRGQP